MVLKDQKENPLFIGNQIVGEQTALIC